VVNIKAMATTAPGRAKGRLSPTAGLNVVVKTKIFTLPELDPQFGGHPTHTKTYSHSAIPLPLSYSSIL
jgi:hypothetical protein